MRIFLSAEVEQDANNLLKEIINEIEEKLKFVCERNIGLENINNYGNEFKNIGIICIIVPNNMKKDWWTERKLIKRKMQEADIRLYIDYEKFLLSPKPIRKLMYIKNISDSIDVVIAKSKGDFRGKELKEDIFKALDVTQELIDKVVR